MHKIKPDAFTTEMVKNNFKGTLEKFVLSDNAFSFIISVTEQFLYDVLDTVKQLGISTYFITLSCVDLRWDELPYIINKFNNLGLNDEELRNLNYLERCNLLSNNPVLVARHFQYTV